jgi:ATP-binding cassette subfamily B protein/subfamily B ATP-binding cassette protein MsbA
LDQSSEIRDPENPAKVESPHRSLRFDDIGFRYEGGKSVIENVSLDIPFGSTIAVVGSNGSGKSTLIDGVDIRDMRVDDIRGRIAMVNQQTELFKDSVAYNIRYGKPDATDEEVEEVARRAHAHDFITTALPQGYETNVGRNGGQLSGGQRQRIALARALLCKPEILILDEATSQIDMQSEQAIRESLAEMRGECTTIIITHREKLLELADRVFEVVDGRLVERPALVHSNAA